MSINSSRQPLHQSTGNIDNIDHNPSSSSRDSFHGTAISTTHHTTNENAGDVRNTWKQHRIDLNRKENPLNPYPNHTLMCHLFVLLTIQI